MRSSPIHHIAVGLVLAALAPVSASKAQAPASAAHADRSGIVWGPAPATLPPGAEIAVLDGNPSQPGPFTLRLRFPNGYKIPPHTHPTAENVTLPANHPHYAMARGVTVIQVHAIGPFALTYVDPADAPVAR